ncbi:MAG: tRNA (adenosine(37)-N6)-threonylcarbamoyltransferase complex ATPase subunit type 1 TsaE [Candidatus Omnitrophota bacterium]|nr:tRNA (adenosine(37)-N6)-threonylcarbamoyltransferase complex ATPase subunit type 1 TsaE [Candidatus Omnitrophota bacterium]MBU1894251.1 tRNA (adenosine(37)-N6)-threonylcarbamoyltransferase complex ATPase subunit type 1 TsaE [Candidatus Omnitrophota bacterium]
MENIKKITTSSPLETMNLGEKIAKQLKKGDLVALVGELGAGKTVFVKGLANGLGVKDASYVNSPSFVIIKEYEGQKNLYHFDVYRIDLRSFCETLDYKRYFYGCGITVIEWADKIKEVLPEQYLEVTIKYGSKQNRLLSFRAIGGKFKKIIAKI